MITEANSLTREILLIFSYIKIILIFAMILLQVVYLLRFIDFSFTFHSCFHSLVMCEPKSILYL